MQKLKHLAAIATIAAALIAFVSCPPAAHAQTPVTVGSGPDSSFLVIEGFTSGPLVFELRFTHNAATPLDGHDLLTAVLAAHNELMVDFVNFGTAEDPSFFVNSITYQSQTLVNTPFPDVGPFWAQWVSGGQAGFPTPQPVANGTWEFGSGLSEPFRVLEPGAWDGYIFNEGDDAPSVSPVPEPGSLFLVLGAAGCLLVSRRRTGRAACDGRAHRWHGDAH